MGIVRLIPVSETENSAELVERMNLIATDNTDYGWETTTVHALQYSTDSNLISSVTGDGSFRTWDTTTGEIVETNQLANAPIHAAALSPDRTLLAFGDAAGTLQIIEAIH